MKQLDVIKRENIIAKINALSQEDDDNKDTYEEIIEKIAKELKENFKFGDIYLFLDISETKYAIYNSHAKDKYESYRTYEKSNIHSILESIIITRQNNKELAYFPLSHKILNLFVKSIRGVKKSFHRKESEFYIDSDHLPTLNLFKRTQLLDFMPEKKIQYSELVQVLQTQKYARFYLLLKNNIGDAQSIEWFLNWIAMEINAPEELKTSFVIVGEQGTGKGILVEEIFQNNIYHFSNVSIIDNKTLADNFNDIYNHKAFIIMNEISTMNMRQNNQIAQDLKRLITDGTFIYRGMRKSGVEKKITFNIAFTTNKNIPIQIEQGDRRFSVFGRAKKLIELQEFIGLNEDINSFVEKVALEIREFLYFVKALDYNKKVATEPIMTELKQNIINSSNNKEDLLKSLLHSRDYNKLENFLKQFDFHDEELFYFRLKHMFNAGIFSTNILFDIYCAVFGINLNEYNMKGEEKKSGFFWSKLLHKTEKSQIKISNNKVISFKVFDAIDLDSKKEILKKILRVEKIEEFEAENDALLLLQEADEVF